jgi:hypothetical protein
MATYLKDPDAVLDFAFDWSAWLGEDETITSHLITAADGLTVDSDSESGGVVTYWLSGGTPGPYAVACLINTNQGRTDERTDTIAVVEL